MIGALQWPAMATTLLAAWLVASQSKRKRSVGFWVFIVSNVLWTIWGLACTGIRARRASARTLRPERPRSAQERALRRYDPFTG
jgi:hypothetical protein